MQHVTELNKIDSLEFLTKWDTEIRQKQASLPKQQQQPFFLTVSFFATHARDGQIPSYQPQNQTRLNVYPNSTHIPTPKTATKVHHEMLPKFLQHDRNEGITRWKNRFDPKSFQSNIKDMYSMATEVDDVVGAVIDKLKSMETSTTRGDNSENESSVYDETLLIFTTDNGNLHVSLSKFWSFPPQLGMNPITQPAALQLLLVLSH